MSGQNKKVSIEPSCSHSADIFDIITSLRGDKTLAGLCDQNPCTPNDSLLSQLYMLSRHRDRMLAAAKAFHWPEASQRQIACLEGKIRDHLESAYGDTACLVPLKLRITLSSKGLLEVTSSKVDPVPQARLFPKAFSDLVSISKSGQPPTFRIFISMIPITPNNFTRHKTTNRRQYDDVRSKMAPLTKQSDDGITHLPVEILLINGLDEIMEGSFTTPYFNRDGHWVTPSVESGGNLGTTRQYALDKGFCSEMIVKKKSVSVGEKVVLSNGVRGFGWGFVEEIGALQGH